MYEQRHEAAETRQDDVDDLVVQIKAVEARDGLVPPSEVDQLASIA